MGAWAPGEFENDSAQEFLDGVSDLLKHCLLHGMWSRYQEEGIAAAGLLLELPQVIRDRIGASAFAEALECVTEELKHIGDWKSPRDRQAVLREMQRRLKAHYRRLSQAEEKARVKTRRLFVKCIGKNPKRKSKP